MTTKYKLDIFSLFNKIDSGDLSFYEKMSDEEKKNYSPLIIMRWLSGCNDLRQIVFLNTLVNRIVFPLAKHPELLSKLLVVSSSKQKKRYTWTPLKKISGKTPNKIRALTEFYGYSEREAKYYLNIIDNDTYLDIASKLGWQKDEISKLQKELV